LLLKIFQRLIFKQTFYHDYQLQNIWKKVIKHDNLKKLFCRKRISLVKKKAIDTRKKIGNYIGGSSMLEIVKGQYMYCEMCRTTIKKCFLKHAYSHIIEALWRCAYCVEVLNNYKYILYKFL